MQQPLTVPASADYIPLFADDEAARRKRCTSCWYKAHPGPGAIPPVEIDGLCQSCEIMLLVEAAVRHIERHARQLEWYHETLTNLAMNYREQVRIWPLQIIPSITYLWYLRREANQLEQYLKSLLPDVTKRLQPHACIRKLADLDTLLTEALLTIVLLGEMIDRPERIKLHMDVRAAFPVIINCYQDTLAQLIMLADPARLQSLEPQEEGVHASARV